MPVPLIAAALIAVSTASGGGGLALGGKGARDIQKARGRIKSAESRYKQHRTEYERAVSLTNDHLRSYGELQTASRTKTVGRMGEFLRRHAKQVRESQQLVVDGIDITFSAVPAAERLDVDAATWVRGIVGASLSGVSVSAGVSTAVGTFGVASTGAAISGLSGAAAESATLAFLGGGSLASGGGGMALGATVLNFVMVGPALLVGGFVVKGRGQKALTQAQKCEARLRVETAQLSESRAVLTAIDSRTEEVSRLLDQLTGRAADALDVLESEVFDPRAHALRFQHALNLVMAVRDVVATPVVDGAGDLNHKTDTFFVKYRPMAEEAA